MLDWILDQTKEINSKFLNDHRLQYYINVNPDFDNYTIVT